MKGIRLILLPFSSVVAWAADRPKLSANPSLIIRAYNTNSAPARDLMEMKESASEVFSHSGIEVEWISCSSVSTAALAPHEALELDIHLFNLASAPDNILSHAMQDSVRVLATGGVDRVSWRVLVRHAGSPPYRLKHAKYVPEESGPGAHLFFPGAPCPPGLRSLRVCHRAMDRTPWPPLASAPRPEASPARTSHLLSHSLRP
jgi:hypothetical protein